MHGSVIRDEFELNAKCNNNYNLIISKAATVMFLTCIMPIVEVKIDWITQKIL